MNQQADRQCRDIQFHVGDMVFLKLQPYKFKTLAQTPTEKLSPRFYGPFEVLARIGPVAYKLALSPFARIHPVFHVSQLKKAVITPNMNVISIPDGLTGDFELTVEPEGVLQVQKLLNGELKLLIKWKHLPSSEHSWEIYNTIVTQFPYFHLEDKVSLQGMGNDTADAVGQ